MSRERDLIEPKNPRWRKENNSDLDYVRFTFEEISASNVVITWKKRVSKDGGKSMERVDELLGLKRRIEKYIYADKSGQEDIENNYNFSMQKTVEDGSSYSFGFIAPDPSYFWLGLFPKEKEKELRNLDLEIGYRKDFAGQIHHIKLDFAGFQFVSNIFNSIEYGKKCLKENLQELSEIFELKGQEIFDSVKSGVKKEVVEKIEKNELLIEPYVLAKESGLSGFIWQNIEEFFSDYSDIEKNTIFKWLTLGALKEVVKNKYESSKITLEESLKKAVASILAAQATLLQHSGEFSIEFIGDKNDPTVFKLSIESNADKLYEGEYKVGESFKYDGNLYILDKTKNNNFSLKFFNMGTKDGAEFKFPSSLDMELIYQIASSESDWEEAFETLQASYEKI